MQRCVVTYSRKGLHIGTSINQHLGKHTIASIGCPMECGHAITLGRVNIETLLYQLTDHGTIATHRSISDL
jgi:hypothetical protein